MIDLKTCTRADFIEAYENLENSHKHLESEVHYLNERLQEYEGIQTDGEKEAEFQKFWAMYEKKGNLKTTRTRWNKLSNKKKKLIFDHLPKYVKSTYKDARYPSRKNAEVYISKEAWLDEIIENKDYQKFSPQPTVGSASFKPSPIKNRSKELDRLREQSKSVNIKERLGL
jgi:hypothetical protein